MDTNAFRSKIANAESTQQNEFVDYLREYHNHKPGRSAICFEPYLTPKGINSYALLAQTLLQMKHDQLRVLDLACGDGVLTQYCLALKPHAQFELVDMSESELQLAKKRLQNQNINFTNQMAQSLNFANQTFDAVLCHMAFMLMRPIDAVVYELFRILKTGGVFAGVVGRAATGESDPAKDFLIKNLRENWSIKYPTLTASLASDQRVANQEGLTELFLNSEFAQIPKFEDATLRVKGTPEAVTQLFSEMYTVEVLPDADRDVFCREFVEFLHTQKDEKGLVSTNFNLLIFQVTK